LRQAAGHDDQARRAERRRGVDVAPVVDAHFVAVRRIGRKQPAPAKTRKLQAGVPDRLEGTLEPYRVDLVAPWADGGDTVPRAGVDDAEKVGLLAHGGAVDGEQRRCAA
jgi:hypothetical protein